MAKVRSKSTAISVKGLRKSYGNLKVLTGIDFEVPHGSILALLGPNGAGKTTTIRILSTLLQPDGGKATIDGHDVIKQPEEVKASIGLTGQYAAVDEYLTGEENLLMIGRLYRLSNKDSRRRTTELLERFDLVEAARRPVRTYSGGMKRRIDLAMSIIASPPVIFLDEPTTGLDPRSRLTMWEIIKQLAKGGTTILLTTQYMDEADQLADSIVVIDNGKVIAQGTSDQLKAKVGAARLEISFNKKDLLDAAVKVLDENSAKVDVDHRMISISSKDSTAKLKEVLTKLDDANIKVESFALHKPTLDDVFLTLTGHSATQDEEDVKGNDNGRK